MRSRLRRHERSAVLAFLLARAASAAEVTLTFEDLPPGTTVGSQYQHSGGTDAGVVLGQAPSGGAAGVQPRIETAPAGSTASGTQGLGIAQPTPPEFQRYGIWGKFPSGGKHAVAVAIGGDAGEATTSVSLVGVDAAGNDLAGVAQTVGVVGDGQYTTPLAISDPAGRIAFFKIVVAGQQNPGLRTPAPLHRIDDLAFDVPDVPPAPDFALFLDLGSTAGFPLTVSRGGTSSQFARVVVNRIGGSNGMLDVGSTGLPAGVTAVVVPDVAASPSAFTIRLSATPTATLVGTGSFTFTASPASPAVGPAPRSIAIPFAVLENYDLTIAGIDVTQGIQYDQALPPRPASPNVAATYDGVPLVAGKKTSVRVFASVVTPAGTTVSGARIRLHGRSTQSGQPLPGSPISMTVATVTNGDTGQVTADTLRTGTAAGVFGLPPSWTTAGAIDLEAEVLPPATVIGGATECCPGNNTYRLAGIPFASTGHVNVWALELTIEGQPFSGFPDQHLDVLGRVLPLADGALRTGDDYRATVDVTKIANATTWGDATSSCGLWCSLPLDHDKALIEYAEDFHLGVSYCPKVALLGAKDSSCPEVVVGFVDLDAVAGLSRGTGIPVGYARSVANLRRPLTSLGHEIVHGLGARHASGGCGGDDNGQTADSWPDAWGTIQGIGYDGGAVLSTGNAGANKQEAADAGAPAGSWFDFMSYCANVGYGAGEAGTNTDPASGAIDSFPYHRADTWISTVNWKRLYGNFQLLATFRANVVAPVARGAGPSGGLLVRGVVDQGHTVVTHVRPGAVTEAAPATSLVHAVVRDRAGTILADVPMRIETSEGHGHDAVFIDADVPLAGAGDGVLPPDVGRLEIVAGGQVDNRLERSASPPTVTLGRVPRRIGKRRTTTLRWDASDADGDELSVTIDYSADDGGAWRTVHRGPNAGRVKLPTRLFTASDRARLRVRANDGFDETIAVSDPIVVAGHRPTVRIRTPAAGASFPGDGGVYVHATASDDGFRDLTSTIEWLDGRRRVATGSPALLQGLHPGRHKIRAVARDARGRKGSATAKIRLERPAAQADRP
jgi:hypothetical protein